MTLGRIPFPRYPRVVLFHLLALAVGSVAIALGGQRNDELDRIAAALQLREGLEVADIGAGDGRFAWDLARRVGSSGRVLATEVDAADLRSMRRYVERNRLDNVTVVEGTQEASGLTAACCDAMLLRNVYHHFADPPAMLRDMRAALRAGGRLLLIDFDPGDLRVPAGVDRDGHGLTMATLIDELETEGWRVVERFEQWGERDGHYAVVFTPAIASPTD